MKLKEFDPVMALQALRGPGAVSVELVPEALRRYMWDEASLLPFVQSAKYTGKRKVEQNLSACRDLPAGGFLRDYAACLQEHLTNTFAQLPEPVFSSALKFNELVVQRYASHAIGVGAHQDFSIDRNLICVTVIGGDGQFCLCDDGEGTNKRPLDSRPGCVIIMRAPGFLGLEEGQLVRPWHGAFNITSDRIVLTTRQLA